nr:hypothetical protein [Amylibacter sp.]
MDWVIPNIEDTVGPFDPTAFDNYNTEKQQAVDACVQKLNHLTDTDLLILIERPDEDPDEVVNAWTRFARRDIERLGRDPIPWYIGGFGHPDYVADFEYWAQSPYYSAHEALLLSVGVEPTHITEQDVSRFAQSIEQRKGLWEPLVYLVRRKQQFDRKFPPRIGSHRVRPVELFGWFEQVNLSIHPKFHSHYLTDKPPSDDVVSKPVKTDKREIDSICQLFVALSIEYYGYRTDNKRSPVPREITDLMAQMGIEMSEDTVRKYLRRGAKFLPSDWEPNKN